MNNVTETSDRSVVTEGYERCEKIVRTDKPHLYAAAQLFPEAETRKAFVATYTSMRGIDDFVDGIPDRSKLSDPLRQQAKSRISAWLENIRQTQKGDPPGKPEWHALCDTFTQFDLPIQPWSNLAEAMESDLFTPHFQDWNHLRRYMHGASVAPAVVFMYLVLMRRDTVSGRFVSPLPYEAVEAATEDLAIFCYWTHILRDVAIDLSLGGSGLIYLPEEDLRKFNLTFADLRQMKRDGKASSSYQQLAVFEAGRARRHLEEGQRHMPRLLEVAPHANFAALQALVETYVNVLDDLESRNFDVFAVAQSHEA